MKFEIKNRWSGNVQFTTEIDCDENVSDGEKLGLAVKAAIEEEANLKGANLMEANLMEADLMEADLEGASLWRANLSGADLREADLTRANLREADLREADLTRANLREADLREADLTGANLRKVILKKADLTGANLRKVILKKADLTGADLRKVSLKKADLREADLGAENERILKSCLWMTLTRFGAEVPSLEVPSLVTALQEGRIEGSDYKGECSCLIGTIARSKQVPYTELDPNPDNPSEIWFSMISEGDKPDSDNGGGYAIKRVLEWIKEWQSLQPVDPTSPWPIGPANLAQGATDA